MRLVKSVDIRDFRGIRRLEKPLELGEFNVLLGRNCVGKSSILQALYLLAMPFRNISVPPYALSASDLIERLIGGWNRLVYGYSGKAEVYFEFGVKGMLPRVSYALETYENVAVEQLRLLISSEGFVDVETELPFTKAAEKYSFNMDQYRELVGSLNPTSSVLALYITSGSYAYERLHEFSYKNIDGIVKKGLHVKIFKDLLNEVVYDKFTEVFPRENELYVRKELEDNVIYVRLNDLGEGIKRFVLTYFAVEYLNPALILWDDIEFAAHPSLLDTLMRWLAGSGRQVVVATHSVDVLESVVRVEPKDARVILLRKDAGDVVHYRSLELGELEGLLSKGLDPRALVEGLVP
jgi:energy-coupling factor transporter ATP-binding protein EcfA2